MRNLNRTGRKALALFLLSSLVLSFTVTGFAAEPGTGPPDVPVREQAASLCISKVSDLEKASLAPGGVLVGKEDLETFQPLDFPDTFLLGEPGIPPDTKGLDGVLIPPKAKSPEGVFGVTGFSGTGFCALSDEGREEFLKPYREQVEGGASFLFVSGEDSPMYSLIRKELSFTGLLVCETTDKPVDALLAGADLVVTDDVDQTADDILSAIDDGRYPKETLSAAFTRTSSYLQELKAEETADGPQSEEPKSSDTVTTKLFSDREPLTKKTEASDLSESEPSEKPQPMETPVPNASSGLTAPQPLMEQDVSVPVSVFADGDLFETGQARVYQMDGVPCLKESEVRDLLRSFEAEFPDTFEDHSFAVLNPWTSMGEVLSDTFLSVDDIRYISLGADTNCEEMTLVYLPNCEEPGSISAYYLNERNGFWSIEISDLWGASQEDLPDASARCHVPAGSTTEFDLPWYEPPHMWRAAIQGPFRLRVQQVLDEESVGEEPAYRARITVSEIQGPALITSEEAIEQPTGRIEISMEADGYQAKERNYRLTLELWDGDWNPSESVVGFCKFDAAGKRLEYSSFSSDTKTFTLRDGESVQLLDIPFGYHFRVTEDPYPCTTQIRSGTDVTESRIREGEVQSPLESFTFLNHFASVPDLPNTGERSELYVVLGGFALLVLGAFVLRISRKKK